MSTLFFIPICVATVTLGFIVTYICCETNYCTTCDQKKSDSEDYNSTPCI